MISADELREKVGSLPWALWARQTAAVIMLELKRNSLGRRSLFVLLLALAPVGLIGLWAILPVRQQVVEGIGGLNVLYAIIFRTFFLRLAVFFGCVGIFTRLFRGDVLERTLHYYLLCPAPREILVVGKYLSGVILNFTLFGISTVLSYFLLFLPSGWSAIDEFIFQGAGLGYLMAYLGITLLACVGYGAVFLLIGLAFRNPIVPAATILGWESINFLLPPFLKKFSVIYYLESLCPVPIPEGPVTILAEPAPFWMAVPGLVGLTILVLFIASLRIRHIEISYAEE
jgi:hypothetical protein